MADKCEFVEDFVALIDSKIREEAQKGMFRCYWGCQGYLYPTLAPFVEKHYQDRGFFVGKSSYDRFVGWIRSKIPGDIYSGWDAEKALALTLKADVAPVLKLQWFCIALEEKHNVEAFQHEYGALSLQHATTTETVCDLKLRPEEIDIFTDAVVQELMQTPFHHFMKVSLVKPGILRLEFTHRQRIGN